MGNVYYIMSRFDEAITCYLKSIEQNPDNSECYFNLANAYGEKKDFKSAIDHYKKAIKLDGQSEESYLNLARIF